MILDSLFQRYSKNFEYLSPLFLFALQYLPHHAFVGARALGKSIEVQNGFAIARRFCQTDGAGHHILENRSRKMRPHFGYHLARQTIARIIEREKHSHNSQMRLQIIAPQLDGAEELGKPFQRIILRLHRDDYLIGRHQTIDSEESQRRRTIDQDIIVIRADLAQDMLQAEFPILDMHHLDLRAGQILPRRNDVQAFRIRPQDDFLRCETQNHRMIEIFFEALGIDAQARRGIALRIQIHQKHLFPGLRQIARNVDRRSGFPPPAFLIDEPDDCSHRKIKMEKSKWKMTDKNSKMKNS